MASSSNPIPPPVPIRLKAFLGVNSLADRTMTPEGFLWDARNLRFDRQVGRVRAGFTTPLDLNGFTMTPITGLTSWRGDVPGVVPYTRQEQLIAIGTLGDRDQFFMNILTSVGGNAGENSLAGGPFALQSSALGGYVSSASLTAVGSGYTSTPTVTPASGAATFEVELQPTSVASVTVNTGGSGYVGPTWTLTFTGGGGHGADGLVQYSVGHVVTGIVMTSGGTGYTSAPTVTLQSASGSGATFTAVLAPTSVASVKVGSGGSNYTSAPALNFSGGGGSGAAATAVVSSPQTFTTTGGDFYFSQLDSKKYGVNGADGVFSWDGISFVKAVPLTTPPAMVSSPAFAAFSSLAASWASTDGTNLPATTDTSQTDPFDRATHVHTWEVKNGTSAIGAAAYLDLGSALDLTTQDRSSANLVINLRTSVPLSVSTNVAVFLCDGDASVATQLGTSHPASDSLHWFRWDVQLEQSTTNWQVFNLPLGQVPRTILSSARYLVFLNNGVSLLESTATTSYIVYFGTAQLPGRVSGGTRFYKLQARNSSSSVLSDVPPATSVPMVEWSTGPLDPSAMPTNFQTNVTNGQPVQRALFPIPKSTLDPRATDLDLYRAVFDPANTDPDSMTYFLAKTVAIAAQSDPILLYDSDVDDTILVAQPAYPGPSSPPATGNDAPRYLLSTGTRMAYASSRTNPARLWLSNVGQPFQSPNIDRLDLTEIDLGIGAFTDIGRDLSDEIVGLERRVNQLVVLKRSGLWTLDVENEGASDEYWTVDALQRSPGCVSSRGHCRVPEGIVYAAPDGMYFLRDGTSSSVLMSHKIQSWYDAIPATLKAKIGCAYNEAERLLYVAIGEPGQAYDSALAVLDLRVKDPLTENSGDQYFTPALWCWAGKWKLTDGSESPPKPVMPGLLFTDRRDDGSVYFYVTRADEPKLDRQLLLTEPSPWADYGTPISFAVRTGWNEPVPTHKMRLIYRRVDFLTDGIFGATGSVTGTLTLTCRGLGPSPNTVTQGYDIYFEDLSTDVDGLRSFAQEVNMDVAPRLEGEQFTIEFEGTVIANEEFRLGLISASYVDTGITR